MTEKEQLIARVTELSAKLGRDADITGTVAELKARVEELEAELADNSNSLNGGSSDGQLTPHSLSTAGGDTASDHRLISIIPKVTLHLRRGQDLLLAVKDEPCPIDADQARQVVEVEQLARYADE
ncbi:DNA-packaging protein FI [Aeromonas veronii]|uniref:DNA-packaging protein FI n=1 Tax=Aeromonas veronii TaxID=654 RepID=UPI0023638541|nr:DNA-packaging protein FI [Aeromonas veronii]MDD1846560.1 DNA-packaging protein FI [Aeromonas veronii]